jgi:phosphoglycolate phosphatase
MNSNPTIIFDFDGTLVDSQQTYLDLIMGVEPELAKKKVAEGLTIEELRNNTIPAMLKKYNVSYMDFLKMAWKAQKVLSLYIQNIKLFDGIRELLEQLNKRKIDIFILSSNKKENIITVIKKEGIDTLIKDVKADRMIFGKAGILEKMIRQNNLQKEKTLYVGDEVRDIEASRQAEIKSIAVSWGFNDPAFLKSHKPDFIAEKPNDILLVCNQYFN